MSVAKRLGVDNLDAPNMRGVRVEWPRWQQIEPVLAVVDDFEHLPRWLKRAQPGDRDAVLAAMLRIADTDHRARVALSWLLMPGASMVAGKLRRLADVIDEVVAGQLWIQICEHDPSDQTLVAKKILTRVERESMAELGVGDLAKRRDPTWTATVVSDRFDDLIPADDLDEIEDAGEQLSDLLRRALDSGRLSDVDRDLLIDLAHAAQQVGAPLRRGRAGSPLPRSRRWCRTTTRWPPARSGAMPPMPSTYWGRWPDREVWRFDPADICFVPPACRCHHVWHVRAAGTQRGGSRSRR